MTGKLSVLAEYNDMLTLYASLHCSINSPLVL